MIKSYLLFSVICLFSITNIATAEDTQTNCAELDNLIKAGKLGKVLSSLQSSFKQYQIDYANEIDKVFPQKVGDYSEVKLSEPQKLNQDSYSTHSLRQYKKEGAPEIRFHIYVKLPETRNHQSCHKESNSVQKIIEFDKRIIEVEIKNNKLATVCLKDMLLVFYGESVNQEQYLQFIKNLGGSFFDRLESVVAKME